MAKRKRSATVKEKPEAKEAEVGVSGAASDALVASAVDAGETGADTQEHAANEPHGTVGGDGEAEGIRSDQGAAAIAADVTGGHYGQTDQPASVVGAGMAADVPAVAGQPGSVSDEATLEGVSSATTAVDTEPPVEADDGGGTAAVATGGDGAGPYDADAAAADVDPRDKPEDDGYDLMALRVDYDDAVLNAIRMGVRPGRILFGEPPDQAGLNVHAASAAAGIAYASVADPMAGSFFGTDPERAFNEAAAFLRVNPDAPLAALPIHLARKRISVPALGIVEAMAWRVFALVLAQTDKAVADARLLAKQDAARAAAAARMPSAPADRLARVPQPGPRSPTGFTRSR